MKHILLALTPPIPPYKPIHLTTKLIQSPYHLTLILSHHPQHFLTPLPFQPITTNPLYTNTFKQQNPQHIQHLSL
ncbi:HFCD family protein, partial [Staphylococcus epidermidis]